MNKQEFVNKIWNYYIVLEDEFIDTQKYVELDKNNFSAYSKTYIKLLLSIGSEIDILCKYTCKLLDKDSNASKMNQYRNELKHLKSISESQVYCEQINEALCPWDAWTDEKSPKWWRSYNNVKHDRLNTNYFRTGNLENVLISLSALYVLCRVSYKHSYDLEPFPKSRLFEMNGWTTYELLPNGFYTQSNSNGSLSFKHLG